MAGRNAAALVLDGRCACRRGRPRSARWRYYVSHADPRYYQPTNITFGIIAPIDDRAVPRLQAPTAAG